MADYPVQKPKGYEHQKGPEKINIDLVSAGKDLISGIIKGNSTDILGTPVDVLNFISNLSSSLLSKNSTSFEEDIPGGSKDVREAIGVKGEDSSAVESLGTMFSIGGVGKAMILPFVRGFTKSDRELKIGEGLIKQFTADKKLRKDQILEVLGGYVDTNAKGEKIVKKILPDGASKLNEEGMATLANPIAKEFFDLHTSGPGGPAKAFDHIVKNRHNPAKNEYKSGKLEDIFDHDELYKLYPEFKDIKVTELDPNSHMFGSMAVHPKTGEMEMGLNFYEMGYDKEKIRSTILHELQHAVQRKEGFIPGGSPTNFRRPVVEKAINEAKIGASVEEEMKLKLLQDNLQQLYMKQYKNIPGEQEARFTQHLKDENKVGAHETLRKYLGNNLLPTNWETK